MKSILDRLMARQQRLLESLSQPLPSGGSKEAVVDRGRFQAAEQAALEAALADLESGDMRSARDRLAPWSEQPAHVMTLIVLAGIASAEGDFDSSLALLLRAQTLDPADKNVWKMLADAHLIGRRFAQEAQYRRKLVFAEVAPTALSLVQWARAIAKATPAGGKLPVNEIRLAVSKLEQAADVDFASRTRMAELVYAAGLRDDAVRLYHSTSAAGADEADAIAQWRRTIDHCSSRNIELHSVAEGGVPGRRPMVAWMSDVVVHPALQWIPMLDDRNVLLREHAMQRLKCRSENSRSPLLLNSEDTAVVRLPRNIPRMDAPALLIGGMTQYYHQTVEFLSSLAVAERTGIGADLPIVVNADLAPFQLEQFEMLGIDSARLIRVSDDQPMQFTRLCVPSRLVLGGRWIDPLISTWYRERFVSAHDLARPPNRRLYLSRRGAGRRRLVNEDDLVAALARHGFEVVQPEALSVRQQVQLFAEASHVVGPSGAAFTNILFAPPDARVVALFNQYSVAGRGDLYWDALSAACSHRFKGLSCKAASVRTSERIIDADIVADIEAVLDALAKLETRSATGPRTTGP